MSNFFSSAIGTLAGAATGFMAGGPAGAVAGGLNGAINGGAGPSNAGNIAPSTDPTLGLQQGMDKTYEYANLGLEAEQLRHQYEMQSQSQDFNQVQDEKSEQMREMNTLREVAMKQREADDKIVKEFIKTAGGE